MDDAPVPSVLCGKRKAVHPRSAPQADSSALDGRPRAARLLKQRKRRPAAKRRARRTCNWQSHHPKMRKFGTHEQFDWPSKFVDQAMKKRRSFGMSRKLPWNKVEIHEEFAGYGTATLSLEALISRYNQRMQTHWTTGPVQPVEISHSSFGELSNHCQEVLRRVSFWANVK